MGYNNKLAKANFDYERTNVTHKAVDKEKTKTKAPTKPSFNVKLSSMATTAIPEPIQEKVDSDEDLEEMSKVLEQMAGVVLNELVPELRSENQHNEIDDVTTRSNSLIEGMYTNKTTKADFEYERTNITHKDAENKMIDETKAPTKHPFSVKLSSTDTTAISEPIQKKKDYDRDLEEMSMIHETHINKKTKADFEFERTNITHNAAENELIDKTKSPTKPPFNVKQSSLDTTVIPETSKKKEDSNEYVEERSMIQETYIKKKTKADLDSERTNTMHKTANNEMINKTLTKPPFNVKLSPMATTAPPEPIKKKVESYEDIEEMAGIVLDEISSELPSEKEHNEIDDDPEKKEILLQEKYTFNPIERMNTMHKVTDNEMINESKAPTKPSFNVKISSMATTAIPEPIQKKVESAEDLEEMSKVLEQMAGIVLNEIVPELLKKKKYIEIDYERTNVTHKAADKEITKT